MEPRLLRVNAPTVVSETVDGEVVIIHLDTGNYYSLNGTAALIWTGVERGVAPAQMSGVLTGAGLDATAFATFLSELEAEDLLVPAPDDTVASGEPFSVDPSTVGVPVLEKYTDMQHLILLDPVHEVDDDTGWPRAREDA